MMTLTEPRSLSLGILEYERKVKAYRPEARCRLSKDGRRYEIIDASKGRQVTINLWGIDSKVRSGEVIAGVPFSLRDPAGLREYRAWQAAYRKLSGDSETIAAPWSLDDIAATILERRSVPSQSDPNKTYELIRTPSGWSHVETSCSAWVTFGTCSHVERA